MILGFAMSASSKSALVHTNIAGDIARWHKGAASPGAAVQRIGSCNLDIKCMVFFHESCTKRLCYEVQGKDLLAAAKLLFRLPLNGTLAYVCIQGSRE